MSFYKVQLRKVQLFCQGSYKCSSFELKELSNSRYYLRSSKKNRIILPDLI